MLFPTFLKLKGRRVLLVGGGPVAAGKLRGLLDAGADGHGRGARRSCWRLPRAGRTRRCAPFRALGSRRCRRSWSRRRRPTVNREVAAAAHARGIFVNAVDDVESASAYAGAVVRRAGVTIAISTDGDAPALAGLVREALETLLPEDLDRWMECARASRGSEWLERKVPMAERRPLLLDALNALYAERRTAGRLRVRCADVTRSVEGLPAGCGGARRRRAGRSGAADAPRGEAARRRPTWCSTTR